MNTSDFTMKHMFAISAKLVSEQDEVYGVKTINWGNPSWKYLSLIVMNKSSVSSAQRSTYSQILLCLGKMNVNPLVQKFTRIQSFGQN